MHTPLPIRSSVLSLLFLSSVAMAGGPDGRRDVRTLLLSEHPASATHNIYVSGQVTTVLRFEQDCDPARTKLLGWEGRFEPLLVGGRKVVLEPLRDLGKDERIPLLVTLVDGTEIAFLVSPPRNDEEWGWTDQQVNVFKNRESFDAVLSTLYATLKREERLKEENARLKKEEKSVDHAWATLLINGEHEKTPFDRKRVVVLENEDMDIKVELFSGPGKVAAVVHLTNTYNDAPWRFRNAQLTSARASDTRPFALRLDRTMLVQGQSGTIAVVVDQRAFESEEGLVDLCLEIFRGDGLQQVSVMLNHSLISK